MGRVVSEKTYVRFVHSELVDFIKSNVDTLEDGEFRIMNVTESQDGTGTEYITFELKLNPADDDLDIEPWAKLEIAEGAE